MRRFVAFEFGRDAERGQHRQHRFVEDPVAVHAVQIGQGVSGRNDRRVGQVDVVVNVSAAGRAADDRITRLFAFRVELGAADRERRPVPAVGADQRSTERRRFFEQDFIHAHIEKGVVRSVAPEQPAFAHDLPSFRMRPVR